MREWEGFTPDDYARPAPDSTMQLLPAIVQLPTAGQTLLFLMPPQNQPALRNCLNLPRNRLYHPHEFQTILLNVLMIFQFVLQRHTYRQCCDAPQNSLASQQFVAAVRSPSARFKIENKRQLAQLATFAFQNSNDLNRMAPAAKRTLLALIE
jgi:hypothetical protein